MAATNLVTPESQAKVRKEILLDHEQVYEVDGLRKDNSIFPMEVQAKMFLYKGQETRVTALHDITKRKQADESKKDKEMLYGTLFEKSISTMLLIDKDTSDIVDANPSACAYYGYSKQALLNMKITDINILSEEEVHNEMGKAQSEQKNYFNFRHRLSNGSIRDVEVFSGPLTVGGKTLLCSIIHDISERKIREKEREQLIDELQKALDEIKTLEGIVPICSSCKKIRDDKGYWNLLESYIEKHSDASFSHSMCPDCSDKLYGEEDWYIEMKKKQAKDRE
jgi:PAS domain S-box-containing protein